MEVLDVYSTDDLRSFLKVECSMVLFFFFSFQETSNIAFVEQRGVQEKDSVICSVLCSCSAFLFAAGGLCCLTTSDRRAPLVPFHRVG